MNKDVVRVCAPKHSKLSTSRLKRQGRPLGSTNKSGAETKEEGRTNGGGSCKWRNMMFIDEDIHIKKAKSSDMEVEQHAIDTINEVAEIDLTQSR